MSTPGGGQGNTNSGYDGSTSNDGNSGNSGNSGNGGNGGNGNDAYEFIAFLLWYVFLVLCCVIPTCCAYRRRRQVEARLAQQQTNMDRWQATNMFIVASAAGDGGGFRQGSHNEELLQAHRTKYLEQELKATTMMVSPNDIEGSTPATLEAASKSWVKGRIKSLHDEKDEKDEQIRADEKMDSLAEDEKDVDATTTSTAVIATAAATALPAATETAETPTLGYDVEEVENAGSLQLPSASTNGNRSIPAVCTICLCPYENGEHVSWSPDQKCQHAFHKDCIIAWLAKKDEPKCPICRQDFCVLDNVPAFMPAPASPQQQAVPYSFSQSLSRALALSRLEAAAMEQHRTQSNSNMINNTDHTNTVRFSSTAIRNEVADEEMGEANSAIEMATPSETSPSETTVPSQDVYGGRAGFGTGTPSDDNV